MIPESPNAARTAGGSPSSFAPASERIDSDCIAGKKASSA